MTTRARYTLLRMGERTSTIEGPGFQTGRRLLWTFQVIAAAVTTSLTVKLQKSGTGFEDDWEDAHELTLNAAGDETVGEGTAVSLTSPFDASDLWIRGIVSDHDGEYAAELQAWAPFFRIAPSTGENDLSLLPERLQRFDEGGDKAGTRRIVEKAERRILTILGMNRHGRLSDADLGHPEFADIVRDAVATQSELEFQRDRMERSVDAGTMEAVEQMPEIADDVEDMLAPILSEERLGPWHGR